MSMIFIIYKTYIYIPTYFALGLQGIQGPPGIPGLPGLKGEMGLEGIPGEIAKPGTYNLIFKLYN